MNKKSKGQNPNYRNSAKAKVKTYIQPGMGSDTTNADADMKIYPSGFSNQAANTYGAYVTQAITDNTRKYEKSKTAKPSDMDVKDARDWVNFNKQ